MYTLVSVEDMDSDHPTMLRHPVTGRLVNTDLLTVLDVTWYYIHECGGGNPEALLAMPHEWLKALLSFKDEIAQRGEESLRKKHASESVDLGALLGQMRLQ